MKPTDPPARAFDGKRSHAAARPIDYAAINRAALAHVEAVLQRWLPDGRRNGREWVARNPRRTGRHSGSFSVNMNTGAWGDFATGDRGGDLISLAAYLFDLNQAQAARGMAQMLGVPDA